MNPSNVFLAVPMYDGKIDAGTARSVWSSASQIHKLVIHPQGNSLLAANFNTMWCSALNTRAASNLKWFAMLHADIEPDYWWLDKLIAEAEKYEADMLSAVVPIKDARGLTSTAISQPGARYYPYCRLTMKQVLHPSFPETFGINEAVDALANLPGDLRVTGAPREALLVNTGCFVCRIDQPWCERVWFAVNDTIEKIDGQWMLRNEPEDWFFSRKLAAEGAKVMATRTLPLAHKGLMAYMSTVSWGHSADQGPH